MSLVIAIVQWLKNVYVAFVLIEMAKIRSLLADILVFVILDIISVWYIYHIQQVSLPSIHQELIADEISVVDIMQNMDNIQ